MKNMLLGSIFILLLAPGTGRAAAVSKPKKNISCHATPWPLPRNSKLKDLMADLQEMPRELVVQYALGEVLHEAKDSMDLPLFRYLHGSEIKENMRGFYGAIPVLIYGEDAKLLIEKWPKRPKRLARMGREKLCQLYRDTLRDGK